MSVSQALRSPDLRALIRLLHPSFLRFLMVDAVISPFAGQLLLFYACIRVLQIDLLSCPARTNPLPLSRLSSAAHDKLRSLPRELQCCCCGASCRGHVSEKTIEFLCCRERLFTGAALDVAISRANQRPLPVE